MLNCSACGSALRMSKELGERAWSCTSCAGCAVRLSLLREKVSPNVVDALWAAAREQEGRSARACAACQRPMTIVTLPLPSGEMLFLDVCRACHLVWFDRNELAELLQRARREQPSPGARQAVARLETELLAERARQAAWQSREEISPAEALALDLAGQALLEVLAELLSAISA